MSTDPSGNFSRFGVVIELYRGYEFGMPLDALGPETEMGTLERHGFEAVRIPRVGEYLRDLGPWSDERSWTTIPTPTLEIIRVMHFALSPAEQLDPDCESTVIVHVAAPWRQDIDRDQFIKQFTDRGWRWCSSDRDWRRDSNMVPPMQTLGGQQDPQQEGE